MARKLLFYLKIFALRPSLVLILNAQKLLMIVCACKWLQARSFLCFSTSLIFTLLTNPPQKAVLMRRVALIIMTLRAFCLSPVLLYRFSLKASSALLIRFLARVSKNFYLFCYLILASLSQGLKNYLAKFSWLNFASLSKRSRLLAILRYLCSQTTKQWRLRRVHLDCSTSLCKAYSCFSKSI